jgi:hypothetical protein
MFDSIRPRRAAFTVLLLFVCAALAPSGATAQNTAFSLYDRAYQIVGGAGGGYDIVRADGVLHTINGTGPVTVVKVVRDPTYQAAILRIASPKPGCPYAAIIVWAHPDQGDGVTQQFGACNLFRVDKLARATLIIFRRGRSWRGGASWLFDLLGGLRRPGARAD